MSVSVENNYDTYMKSMKCSKPQVGILAVPDDHFKPVLYSDYQATKAYNALDRDIYEKVGKNGSRYKKTPVSVYVFCTIALITAGILGIRKFIKK